MQTLEFYFLVGLYWFFFYWCRFVVSQKSKKKNSPLHLLHVRVICRLSEGHPQGSPFVTHLGDGDPQLQPHPQHLYRSSTPEEEQTLQLVIPELDQSESTEQLLNNSGSNKEGNTSGNAASTKKRAKVFHAGCDVYKYQPFGAIFFGNIY